MKAYCNVVRANVLLIERWRGVSEESVNKVFPRVVPCLLEVHNRTHICCSEIPYTT